MERLLKNMQAWIQVILGQGGKQEEGLSKEAVNKIVVSVRKRQTRGKEKKVVAIVEGKHRVYSVGTCKRLTRWLPGLETHDIAIRNWQRTRRSVASSVRAGPL